MPLREASEVPDVAGATKGRATGALEHKVSAAAGAPSAEGAWDAVHGAMAKRG